MTVHLKFLAPCTNQRSFISGVCSIQEQFDEDFIPWFIITTFDTVYRVKASIVELKIFNS